MKLNVYCAWDSKTEAYLQPMFFRTNNEAIRAFSSACVDEQHAFCKHAADYTLFLVGEFDDQAKDRVISSCTPISLGNALQYKSAGMDA